MYRRVNNGDPQIGFYFLLVYVCFFPDFLNDLVLSCYKRDENYCIYSS